MDERRDSGPGTRIVGRDAILAALAARADTVKFVQKFGPIRNRPAYVRGVWWTGDEDMDWDPEWAPFAGPETEALADNASSLDSGSPHAGRASKGGASAQKIRATAETSSGLPVVKSFSP